MLARDSLCHFLIRVPALLPIELLAFSSRPRLNVPGTGFSPVLFLTPPYGRDPGRSLPKSTFLSLSIALPASALLQASPLFLACSFFSPGKTCFYRPSMRLIRRASTPFSDAGDFSCLIDEVASHQFSFLDIAPTTPCSSTRKRKFL